MPTSVADLSIDSLERLLLKRRRDLARLLKKRQKVERKLAVIDEQIAGLGGSGAVRGTRARNEVSLVEAITNVLAKASSAMKVGDITDKVLATGYRSSSPNFKSIVNQTLIKEKKFKSAGRGLYQLGGR